MALEEQDGEVQRRLRLAAPALAALLQGKPPSGAATLRRNCALHAQLVPDRDDAPLSEWRQAQKGPRLSAAGAGQPAQPSTRPLRAEAPVFRPGPRLPGLGCLPGGTAAPARAALREPRCVDEVLAELPTADLAQGVQDMGLDVLPEELGVPLLGVIADTGDRQAEQVVRVQEDQKSMESELVAEGSVAQGGPGLAADFLGAPPSNEEREFEQTGVERLAKYDADIRNWEKIFARRGITATAAERALRQLQRLRRRRDELAGRLRGGPGDVAVLVADGQPQAECKQQ